LRSLAAFVVIVLFGSAISAYQTHLLVCVECLTREAPNWGVVCVCVRVLWGDMWANFPSIFFCSARSITCTRIMLSYLFCYVYTQQSTEYAAQKAGSGKYAKIVRHSTRFLSNCNTKRIHRELIFSFLNYFLTLAHSHTRSLALRSTRIVALFTSITRSSSKRSSSVL